ncbi:unnamed protein product [Triticum turgidum subsp. durum]|uniref:RING-type domain-containing protein n=1 Tax=Triticum turgidum subsp. durum TaxID=4567 RepID=A0A9R0QPF1_TRITD|nr:unnamed protein product [Triticum turgidum subsp. durum]
MAAHPVESEASIETDNHPLLIDHMETTAHLEIAIDSPRDDVASSSTARREDNDGLDRLPHISEGSSETTTASNSQSAPLAGRDANRARRRQSPLNSSCWISIELVVTVSQIIAAICVLSLSRKEHPHSPLFEWVIGYTVGCVATLPLLYWRYLHRNRPTTGQEPASQNFPPNSIPESNSHTTNSAPGMSEAGFVTDTNGVPQNNMLTRNPRAQAYADHFRMALDCFFAVWFVVGNVWVFGGHSSAHDAPNLYRLCIAFLTFSCIGYAMPFILCALICCCLPCIISLMSFREDLNQNKGATAEAINALRTYKLKTKKSRNGEGIEVGGGVVAAGTNKERFVSAEDAICCICLARYSNNDDLRELPCTHFFHKECVDKWLKINALCPLCKAEIDSGPTIAPAIGFGRCHSDNRNNLWRSHIMQYPDHARKGGHLSREV